VLTYIRLNRMNSSALASFALLASFLTCVEVDSFAPSNSRRALATRSCDPCVTHVPAHVDPARSTSSLSVWWFGGNGDSESISEGADSCELVAVRIERTSPNSRRIAGEITVDATLLDCWAILTDYNRLSAHVPNLVESRILSARSAGVPGDGDFQCRLYQKGAQKIIGFEFGADLTMEMTEKIITSANGSLKTPGTTGQLLFPAERRIGFRCIDSFFFSEFDGEWKVAEKFDEDGMPQTTLSYTVDVRPKGPVPVAALEWRIREDVPTNLRAVKKAAMETGAAGVEVFRSQQQSNGSPAQRVARGVNGISQKKRGSGVKAIGKVVSERSPKYLAPFRVQWADDETMAAYLKKDP